MVTVAPATSSIMAHRGGRHGGTPNSVDAVLHAASVGAGSAEIDVNVTADGVSVATHDAVGGDKGWITEQTYDELLAADADEWRSRQLNEVVDAALANSMVAYLDLKAVTPAALRGVVDRWPSDVESRRIIFATARADVVAWIGANLPTAATSFLYYDRLLDVRSFDGFMHPTFIHPCFDFVREPFRTMNEDYVARARGLGYGLVSWSENDPDKIARLGELGFDFICTDEPELAHGVLHNGS